MEKLKLRTTEPTNQELFEIILILVKKLGLIKYDQPKTGIPLFVSSAQSEYLDMWVFPSSVWIHRSIYRPMKRILKQYGYTLQDIKMFNVKNDVNFVCKKIVDR